MVNNPTVLPVPENEENYAGLPDKIGTPVEAQFDVNPITPPADVPFDIGESYGDTTNVSSPETIQKRTNRFKFGLDEILGKTKEQLFQDLTNGQEQQLREIASSELDKRKQVETQKAITEYANRKGGDLTKDERDGIATIVATMSKSTDPATVLEEAYSKQFMATLDRVAEQNPDNFLNDAKKQDLEGVTKIQEEKSAVLVKREYAQKVAEDIEDEVKGQGWVPWLADQAKSIVPGYDDAKLRGNADVSVFAGLGLGKNLEEQRKALLRLPFEEYKVKLDQIATKLRKDNPSIAAEFVKSVVGMSTDEVFLKNFSTPLDIVTSGVGTGAARGLRKTAEGAATMGEKTLMNGIMKDTAKAADDLLKAAGDPNVSKSSMLEAAGDLKEAAVVKATTNISGDVNNAPEATKRAVEALPSTLRTDIAQIKAGPGRASQELVNRIEENTNTAISNVMNAVENISKVDRLPEALATESAVRAVVENIKDTYVGLKNAVLDVTAPYREKISNTYLVDMHLGKNDGTYFSQRSVAENFINFHGLRTAEIKEGTDVALRNTKQTYYLPESAVKDLRGKANDSFGYKIKGDKATFYSDIVNDIEVVPSTRPGKGLIPVEVEDGVANFGKKIEADKYYLPKSAVQTVGGQANPNFGYEIKNGKPTFFSDITNRVEITPSTTPEKGMVPVDVTDNSAKFGMPLQEVSVEQQGLGFYIKVTKPLNETSDVVRDLLGETKNTKIPDSPMRQFVNSWVGKLRTPEEVLSQAERQNRLVATYTPSVYFDVMKDVFKPIQDLQGRRFSKQRKKFEEWQRVVEAGQDLPDDSGLKGYFFKDIADLETHYQRILKRLPDEDETAAYFAFKTGMEVDRMFRNIAMHRNQQRVGAETHKIVAYDKTGAKIESAEFSGVVKRNFPGGDDNILMMGDVMGKERVRSLSKIPLKEKKEFDEMVKRGEMKIIEIYDPELRELNGFGDKIADTRVRYVASKVVETRELDWNHIPRRGGGHIEYDYDFYVKQAKIRNDNVGGRKWYEGDTTIMPIQLRSMGVNVAKHLNEVRMLLKAKDEEAARAYSNSNLHIDWDTVKEWFTAGPDKTGKYRDARISLNEPIEVVSKGKQIIDISDALERRYSINKSDPAFKNGTKEGSLARQSQVQFTGERDAYDVFTLVDEGSRGNPLYKIAPAKTIDPITSMNRGLTRIAHSNFLDDYKTMSVEHWLKQAGKYLDTTEAEIRHSPFYHYNNTEFRKDAPAEIKATLEAARFHAQQLTGTPSVTDGLLHSAAQKLADSVYSKFGPKALVIEPSWILPKLKDPFSFVRSVAFNAKLGLFNVPQFIVQAGNYSNILGIAGTKYAAPGTYAAQLHFWSKVNSNPAIIKHLDELATKMQLPGASSWKPGEFTEALTEMKYSGFGNTGAEYAALDNPASQKVISKGADTFLDWGQYFFKQGERNAKYGAWYTAFKEFRDANPIGAITHADRATILQRADLLNVNMSRASSSQLHTGVWSVPTQFYTYQIRLMELFAGTRLTAAERYRMVYTNAALYGIPMSAGLTGLPVSELFRSTAMENGYVVGDNFIDTMFGEGVPAAMMAWAAGGGDIQNAPVQDVGNRFGTKGFEFLGSANSKDKTWLDVVGGPAYSILKGTVQQSDGLGAMLLAVAKRDPTYFPPKIEDIADSFKEITSFNTGLRTWAAIQSGRWISKNESYLADTTPAQAIFSALTGLKDQRINNIQTMKNELTKAKEGEAEAEKRFTQEFRRGVLAHKDGSPETAKEYFSRASHWLEWAGFPEDKINTIMERAVNDNESVLDKVSFDYYVRKNYGAKTEPKNQAFKRTLKLQDK